MNNLPTDLENIIINMKLQMEQIEKFNKCINQINQLEYNCKCSCNTRYCNGVTTIIHRNKHQSSELSIKKGLFVDWKPRYYEFFGSKYKYRTNFNSNENFIGWYFNDDKNCDDLYIIRQNDYQDDNEEYFF